MFAQRQREAQGYDDFLRQKVETARLSLRAGHGRFNEEVEAALSRSKLYQFIQSGEVEIVKIGRATLIPVESLARFMESHRRAG